MPIVLQIPGSPASITARLIRLQQPVAVVGSMQSENPGIDSGAGASGQEPLEPDRKSAEEAEQRARQEAEARQLAAEQAARTERLQETIATVLEKLEVVQSSQQQTLQELQRVAVRLAVAVATALTRHEIRTSNARVESLIEEAVQRIGGVPTTVWLNKQDLEGLAEAHSHDPMHERWTLLADPDLAAGDVRVENGAYGLECRLLEQLERIQNDLLEQLDDATTERRRVAGESRPLGRFPDRRSGA